MPYYVIPHAIEKAIEAELDEHIFDPETQAKLIEPISVLSDEQIDELKLTSLVKNKGWALKNKSKLAELTEKYCWLPMMALYHKPFDIAHFQKIIDELVISVKNPDKELAKLQKKESERAKELQATLKEINADAKLINLVNTTQAYLNLRTYRVNVTKRFHYYHLPLLNEIARRLKISQRKILHI